MWIESAADLIVTAVILVVSLTIFTTKIGLVQWIGMQQYLQYLEYASIYPMNRSLINLQGIITATLWQGWMVIFLLAVLLRFVATLRAFTDRGFEKELRNAKLLSRSGKLVIIAIASLLSVTWLIYKTLFFGFLTDFQVSLLLTLLILQTVISQLRVREIRMAEGDSK